VLTIDEAQAMMTGRRSATWHPEYPRDDDVDAASMAVADAVAATWGPRQVTTIADGLVVGTIGFMGPPTAVAGVLEAEVGYGLVPSARNRGLATEALTGIVAAAEQVAVDVRATVAADNAASLRVLAHCGFTLAGSDDDGQLRLRRRVDR
jgi:RimJ/RimL family protein N-acetyltransferase